MAQSDINSMAADNREPKTATENLVGYGPLFTDEENAEAAATAGVLRASFINYDVALDAYAARSDIEDLTHRNARNAPADFADASFMRTDDGDDGTGSSL